MLKAEQVLEHVQLRSDLVELRAFLPLELGEDVLERHVEVGDESLGGFLGLGSVRDQQLQLRDHGSDDLLLLFVAPPVSEQRVVGHLQVQRSDLHFLVDVVVDERESLVVALLSGDCSILHPHVVDSDLQEVADVREAIRDQGFDDSIFGDV